jgi:phosphinothricin acetyltransferase
MTLRIAAAADLPHIVEIYNAAIPGRLATADPEPVKVAMREDWFRGFDPATRPLWVHADAGGRLGGWLSLKSFYGRPAYAGTVEVAVYTHPSAQRRGVGRQLLTHAIGEAPALAINTLLAFVFAHNNPSLALFRGAGFTSWGLLPRVALLDGIERDLAILGRRVAGSANRRRMDSTSAPRLPPMVPTSTG